MTARAVRVRWTDVPDLDRPGQVREARPLGSTSATIAAAHSRTAPTLCYSRSSVVTHLLSLCRHPGQYRLWATLSPSWLRRGCWE